MSAVAEPIQGAPSVSGGRWVHFLVVIGRLLLAGVFLFAAYAKMKPQVTTPWSLNSVETSLSMFAMQVDSYQMLKPAQVLLVAHLLPPFEMFLGLWLLSGIAPRYSTTAALLVLTGFFALMIRTYALGLSINCGCFGTSEQVGPRKIIEDGSFFAFALAVTVGSFWAHRAKFRRALESHASASAAMVPPQNR